MCFTSCESKKTDGITFWSDGSLLSSQYVRMVKPTVSITLWALLVGVHTNGSKFCHLSRKFQIGLKQHQTLLWNGCNCYSVLAANTTFTAPAAFSCLIFNLSHACSIGAEVWQYKIVDFCNIFIRGSRWAIKNICATMLKIVENRFLTQQAPAIEQQESSYITSKRSLFLLCDFLSGQYCFSQFFQKLRILAFPHFYDFYFHF